MKPSLYELTAEGIQITEILEESLGELTPELELRLADLLSSGTDKIDAAAAVVRQLEANCEAAAAESRRLSERAASFAKQADALKARIRVTVDAVFHGKVKTPRFTVWTQTSADTTSYDLAPDVDIAELSGKFPALVRVKYELEKRRIADMVKAGMELPGEISATDHPGTPFVRIK